MTVNLCYKKLIQKEESWLKKSNWEKKLSKYKNIRTWTCMTTIKKNNIKKNTSKLKNIEKCVVTSY